MTSFNDRAIAVIAGVILIVCASSCGIFTPSPVGTDGVRRVTPPGEEWSHVNGISWSPDGTELALTWEVGGSDLLPEGYIYVIDKEGNNPHVLPQTEVEGQFVSPAWSSNNQIAFGSDGWTPGGIWFVNPDDQEAPVFLREGTYCAWGPDGGQLAVGVPEKTGYAIYILNTSTGEERLVSLVPDGEQYSSIGGISWSPTGDRLAFSWGLDDHDASTVNAEDIYVLDLASGSYHQLTQGGLNRFPSWSPDGTMVAFSGGEWRKQTLVVMRVSDGAVIRPLAVAGLGLGPVAWSPDGSEIAFVWGGAVYAIETAKALEDWSITNE